MIITRTPFRITLGGGGTDLPAYYSQYGGFVLSVAINKYMYISLNRPIVDDLIRLKYTISETVEKLSELKHDIAREALKFIGIFKAIEIVSMADIPAGTGLASSSVYTVGLLNGLHAMKRDYVSLQKLAEEACDLEMNKLGKPVGKQDQYIATYGGLTVLDIQKDATVHVRPANVSTNVADDLQRNMMIFFTGVTRNSDAILIEQSSKTETKDPTVTESMHAIKEIGQKSLKALESGNLTEFGILMDEHWQHKKKISTKMSNPQFDDLYDSVKNLGALGAKISGAGGGGFFTVYSESNHSEIRKSMMEKGLRELRYRFDYEGTKVLVNLFNNQG